MLYFGGAQVNSVEAFERFVTGIRQGLESMGPPDRLQPDPLQQLWIDEHNAYGRLVIRSAYAHDLDMVPDAASEAVRHGMQVRVALEELEKILEKVRSNGC